jgi:tRNA dimethylallyltransferase
LSSAAPSWKKCSDERYSRSQLLSKAIRTVTAKPPKPKLVIILGPTAAGKSEVALELAPVVKAEILNADSQQVYRYMDIGTGKPCVAERERVRHHLVDIINPDEEFNAAIFRRLAAIAVADIQRREKQVIVCGGTGLYLKALTQGLFSGPAQDLAIRERLNAEADRGGLGSLYRRLERVDPPAMSRIHPNDRQRIVRALEVFELTGRAISDWQKEHAFAESLFTTLKIGLQRERAELYDRINERCDRMMADGFMDEVNALLSKGYGFDLKPMQTIGYRHLGLVIRGEAPAQEALVLMKRDTRRLAKQQLTWFRSDHDIQWFHPDEKKEIRAAVENFLS